MNVLFVCVGNACRSQMAEAFANHLGGGRFLAWSAGSHPFGEIIPETHAALSEKGLSLDGHWSKGLDEVPLDRMDVIVGMGCEVDCPVPPGFKGRRVEWDIPDPFGHDFTVFRSVRDMIESEVKALLEELGEAETSAPAANQDV